MLFLTWILFLPLLGNAKAFGSTPCFDFTAPIKSPLRDPPAFKLKKDVSLSGKTSILEHGIWGLVRGTVDRPIQTIYRQLLDHYTIKDPKRLKLRVYDQERTGYDNFHLVMITAPTPIQDFHWEEEWGYVITQGSPKTPEAVVISYQKSNGTPFIPHLCGSIVLRSITPKSTDVYLYEEVNALGKRSPKETVQGHLGTLATLRKPRP